MKNKTIILAGTGLIITTINACGFLGKNFLALFQENRPKQTVVQRFSGAFDNFVSANKGLASEVNWAAIIFFSAIPIICAIIYFREAILNKEDAFLSDKIVLILFLTQLANSVSLIVGTAAYNSRDPVDFSSLFFLIVAVWYLIATIGSLRRLKSPAR